MFSTETAHLALHQMDIGNIAPGQTPTPGLGSSNQRTTSSSHGSDSYPDLNNFEYAAQRRQDWNTGVADTSGSSDGELYGLQKGKGKGKKLKFQRHLLQLWKVRSFGQVLLCKKVEKHKERERQGDSKCWNDSEVWTVGKGWSEGEGWNTSGKGWEQQRPAGMKNLERDRERQ